LFANTNGEIYNYTYNADGIRTQKNVFNANGDFTGSTEYIYDGTKLIAENRGGDWLYYFYDANSTVTGMYYNNVLYYFRKNLQGDVTGIYNANGTLVVQYEYTPYGAILGTTGSMATTLGTVNPFRYRGYYYDTETGFYYLITRYYDPVVGRFLNADAFASTGQGILGNNMFAYCGNNPINYVDHTGMLFAEILEGTLEGLAQLLEELADRMNAYSGTKITKHNAHMYAGTARRLYKAICSKAYSVKELAELSRIASKFINIASTVLDIAESAYDNFNNDELSLLKKHTDTAVDAGFAAGNASSAAYIGGKVGTYLSPGWGTLAGMGAAALGTVIIEYTPVDEWVKDGVYYIADGIVSTGEWIVDGVVSAGEWIADGVSSVMDTFCGWFGW